jgi:hypothetical protein
MAADDDLTEDQLLTLPGEDISPGSLSEFFSRRSNVVRQRDFDELIRELTGDSSRHLMLFPGQDVKDRQKQEEEERFRLWLAYQRDMQDLRDQEDQLLAHIEEQQAVVRKRLEDIDDRAIKLHDGRRAYVSGDGYVDEQGRQLTGADYDEANNLHKLNPNAATAAEHDEALSEQDRLNRLKLQVEQARAQNTGNDEGLSDAERAAKLKDQQAAVADYQRQFDKTKQDIAATATQPGGVAAAYSTDYMSAFGNAGATRTTSYSKQDSGDGKLLAADFTPAASGSTVPDKDKPGAPTPAPVPGVSV